MPLPVRLALALALLAAPPVPARADASGDAAREYAEAQQYEDCMALAKRQADDAFEAALAWAAKGGGVPAQHCAAVAQVGMGDYVGAAVRLGEAVKKMPKDQAPLAAEMLAQAGQAWFLADDLERAQLTQTEALKLAPDDVDLLLDRAITRAAAKNYWEAIDDLNRAQELAPGRADVLVYRAAAYRYVDGLDLARDDIDRAVALDPDSPDALLERGTIRRLLGDPAGARADWLAVVTLAAGTPAGDAAQANLEKLDLKTQ